MPLSEFFKANRIPFTATLICALVLASFNTLYLLPALIFSAIWCEEKIRFLSQKRTSSSYRPIFNHGRLILAHIAVITFTTLSLTALAFIYSGPCSEALNLARQGSLAFLPASIFLLLTLLFACQFLYVAHEMLRLELRSRAIVDFHYEAQPFHAYS